MLKLRTLADKTVAAAGTAEPISATSIKARAVYIQGLDTNTNDVYVGDSNVAAGRGIQLDSRVRVKFTAEGPGSSAEFFDLSEIYIDVDTNGEGVKITYII